MKTLKLTIAVIWFLAIGLITAAEINFENAIQACQKVDTDGEIKAVLQGYGFEIGIYDEIGPREKIQALYRLSFN